MDRGDRVGLDHHRDQLYLVDRLDQVDLQDLGGLRVLFVLACMLPHQGI